MNKGIGCDTRTVTAAVYVEFILVDENQSLGKPEKAEDEWRSLLPIRESEDLQEEKRLEVYPQAV